MMFKWLPDVSVAWADVWLGALLTALLFELGKAAIGLYIGKQGLESTYGAAASIVVVLIWVYYTAQIILMGAEITLRLLQASSSSLSRNSPRSGRSTRASLNELGMAIGCKHCPWGPGKSHERRPPLSSFKNAEASVAFESSKLDVFVVIDALFAQLRF